MRTHCAVCGGTGKITDPSCYGKMIAYCGPDGERFPTITCPNCQGERFVGVPDVRHPLIPTDLAHTSPSPAIMKCSHCGGRGGWCNVCEGTGEA